MREETHGFYQYLMTRSGTKFRWRTWQQASLACFSRCWHPTCRRSLPPTPHSIHDRRHRHPRPRHHRPRVAISGRHPQALTPPANDQCPHYSWPRCIRRPPRWARTVSGRRKIGSTHPRRLAPTPVPAATAPVKMFETEPQSALAAVCRTRNYCGHSRPSFFSVRAASLVLIFDFTASVSTSCDRSAFIQALATGRCTSVSSRAEVSILIVEK